MIWNFVSSIRKHLSGGNGPKWNDQFLYFRNKSICFETFHTISCWWFASTLKRSRVYYSPLKLSEFSNLVTFNRGFIQFLLCALKMTHMIYPKVELYLLISLKDIISHWAMEAKSAEEQLQEKEWQKTGVNKVL